MLFIGLGNPGNQYKRTRHNIGFVILDMIAEELGATWKECNKFQANLTSCNVEAEGSYKKIFLLKPLTFMNLSGISTSLVKNFYKLDLDDIIVFHDDIDLKLGEIKYKKGGGAAGHNGLKSLDAHISREYHRIRIGIGRPVEKERVSSYVLENFLPDEEMIIAKCLENIQKAFFGLLQKNFSDIVAKIK